MGQKISTPSKNESKYNFSYNNTTTKGITTTKLILLTDFYAIVIDYFCYLSCACLLKCLNLMWFFSSGTVHTVQRANLCLWRALFLTKLNLNSNCYVKTILKSNPNSKTRIPIITLKIQTKHALMKRPSHIFSLFSLI